MQLIKMGMKHAIIHYTGSGYGVLVMVLNATCNYISVISWRLALLVEETGVPGENNYNLSQVTDKLFHITFYRVHLTWARIQLTALVVVSTDCIGSYL